MPKRIWRYFFPEKIEEKETIVERIVVANDRLTKALDNLSSEVDAVKHDKKRRNEITRLFDDALDAISKE